ncbi:MAG TPA: matrixin family metalloprotease [Segeticoccus sp.]|nr:matrixin family metalloprotease [Segeticoccus sp.]
MMRQLAELDRLDAPQRSKPARRRRGPLVLMAIVGAVAVLLAMQPSSLLPVLGAGRGADHGTVIPHPLGTPAAAPTGSGGYQFSRTEGPGPVTYDPCRPVHLVVNGAVAPPGADQLLRQALDEASHATGLVFVIDGRTDEEPRSHRSLARGALLSKDWPPVLVAWTSPRVLPELSGNVAGFAGSTAVSDSSGAKRYVTGAVNLDGPAIADILHREDGWAEARAIVMHELGHLVGLDHVDDPRQLMFPENTGQTRFGPGDLRGLHELGLGRCAV